MQFNICLTITSHFTGDLILVREDAGPLLNGALLASCIECTSCLGDNIKWDSLVNLLG